MTAETIERMAWYLPYCKTTMDLPDNPTIETHGMDLRSTGHYLACYSNLAFGWKLAFDLANSGADFPPGLEGKDLWIYRAYLWARGNAPDPYVENAMSLTFRANAPTREKIDAILAARDGSPALVATSLGMDIKLIDAYEVLFRNITDRRNEARFLSEIVYPKGRYVEMVKGYMDNEATSTLLMRSGYNNGMTDLLYMAGMPSSTLENSFASPDQAAKLEAYFMMNGLVMARNGFMNQAGVPGLAAARGVMQAAKMGGEAGGVGDSPLAAAGESILGEMKRSKIEQASIQAGMRRTRHGGE